MKLRGYALFVLIYAGSAVFALSAFAKMSVDNFIDNFTIYGKVHLGLDRIDIEKKGILKLLQYSDSENENRIMNDTGGVKGGDYRSIRDSHLGIKWESEFLGNSELLAQMEFLASAHRAEQTYTYFTDKEFPYLFGRNTLFGIKNFLGTFSIGYNTDSIYKLSTEQMDLFNDTLADNSGIFLFDDVIFNHSITYKSPKLKGFDFGVSIWPSRGGKRGYALTSSFNWKQFSLSLALEELEEEVLNEIDFNTIPVFAGPTWEEVSFPAKYIKYRIGSSISDLYGFYVSYLHEKRSESKVDNESVSTLPSMGVSDQIQFGYKYKDLMLKAMYGREIRKGFYNYKIQRKKSTAYAIGIDYTPSFRYANGTKLYILYLKKATDLKYKEINTIYYDSNKWAALSTGISYIF